MANRLQLKRGSGAPGTIFYEGEPIYDKSGKILYVGNENAGGSGAGSAVASASAYSAVTEILNQASSTTSGFIKLLEDTDNGNHNVSLKAPASIASNYSLVLPNGTGSAGQVLKTDGSGNLDWVDQTSGYSGFSITDGSNTQSVESAGTVTFTGGDGITAAVSATDTLTISADLKSNGGLVIGPAPGETAIALDLGASNIYGTLAISDGGTGATTAAAARAGLGVSIGTDVQAHNDILDDLAGLTQAADKLAYFDSSSTAATTDLTSFGRTLVGTASSAAARSELGVDVAGTDNSTDVTLAGSLDYITISGQTITRNAIDLANDVTGSLPNSNLANDSVSFGGVSLDLGQSDATPAFDLSDATNYPTSALSGTITNAQLAGSIANGKLANSSVSFGGVSLSLGGSDATPAFDLSDATNYPTSALSGTITNDQLAGSIANGKLANSSVSYGGVSLSLGGSDATPAFDLSDATNYPTSSLSGTITNAQLAGSIANGKLANSSITVSDGTNSTARALGETLTIQGTANEVTVTESSGTVTVALPDDVTIGNDLTVNGNLNVVGTAVTFSAETTRIEDRILELGLVNGAAPTSATTWDLGVAFNYHDGSAKKSALVWLNNQFVGIASAITETADNTASADPQITIDGFGSLAAKDLYLGGTASSNQIINSSGAAVNLVFDGGSY